jgi:hypothetical protein
LATRKKAAEDAHREGMKRSWEYRKKLWDLKDEIIEKATIVCINPTTEHIEEMDQLIQELKELKRQKP